MTWSGEPIAVSGDDSSIELDATELTDGGSLVFNLNQTGSTVDLPVWGLAPFKGATVASDIQASGTIEYVADGSAGAPAIIIPGPTEIALVVTIGTAGFIFTATVVITGSDVSASTSDVLKGTLSFMTSGTYTLASTPV